ncbi:MAG TPA: ABC transporter permease [Terriglobales bacterium]|nr:ABC transporter permease [Terriglobales bacterium]
MGTGPEIIADSQVAAPPGEDSTEGRGNTTGELPQPRERCIKVIDPPSFSIKTIFTGLRTFAQYSDLLYTLSLFRLNIRYKQSVLGWAWAALQPLALMVIYTIIFTRVTTVATGGIPYPAFVLSGLLPWIFFSGTISNAVNGLVLHPNLLTKMYFPREIIPLSYLFSALVDFGIASLLLCVMLIYYRVPLGWHLLYAIPIVAILAGFAAAIAMFFSALQVRFRDVGLAMPFLLQIWMFTVPVVYSLQAVPLRFRTWYLVDPVAGLIESFRQLVIYGTAPNVRNLAFCGATTLVFLAVTYAFFKSSEATMADLI